MRAVLTGIRLAVARLSWVLGVLVVALLPGCRQKVSAAQCDALLTHYAELVVREKMPGASVEVMRAALKDVRGEASGDEGFRNCTTEVGPNEFSCAMTATTPDAIEKCLE